MIPAAPPSTVFKIINFGSLRIHCQCAATIEAKPANPQQQGPQNSQRQNISSTTEYRGVSSTELNQGSVRGRHPLTTPFWWGVLVFRLRRKTNTPHDTMPSTMFQRKTDPPVLCQAKHQPISKCPEEHDRCSNGPSLISHVADDKIRRIRYHCSSLVHTMNTNRRRSFPDETRTKASTAIACNFDHGADYPGYHVDRPCSTRIGPDPCSRFNQP